MMIPYYLFLLIYLLAVLVVFTFALFNLYHVFRYALKSSVSVVVTSIFVIGFVVMLGVSGVYIARHDWAETFMVSIGL